MSKIVRKTHSDAWNNLPFEERENLMPHMVESQINHILHCRQKAVSAHKKHLKELDDLIKNLEEFLKRNYP